jgi:hypothetical protein
MNDEEREQWVLNNEDLYGWWQSTGIGITTFIRQNRKRITKYIERKLA